MKGKFEHTVKRGLPGGPNEQFTYVTGVFSMDGYRSDSPDVNNPFNIIPSGRITMKEKDGRPLKKGPILGVDNLGNQQMMMPGGEYQFPGNYVTEIPTYQDGGEEESQENFLKNWFENRQMPTAEGQKLLEKVRPEAIQRASAKVPYIMTEDLPNDVAGYYDTDTESIYLNKLYPPDQIKSTKEHEKVHYVQSGDKFYNVLDTPHQYLVDQNIKQPKEINTGNPEWDKNVRANYDDIVPQEEIHARIMTLRRLAGFQPNQQVTEEMLNNYFNSVKESGKTLDPDIEDLKAVTKGNSSIVNLLNDMVSNPVKKQDMMYAQEGGEPGDKFKKRLMKRYPGMQDVYGSKGENLNIVKDPNYDARSYGYGDIEFMAPGLAQVNYENKIDKTLPGYTYVNPSPDKYTSVYNPRGANRADIFLDMMHGMRDDQNYEPLLQTFDKAVREARAGDMQYYYEKDVAKGYTDSQEQWNENYVDGQLRAQLAPGTLGMFSHGRRDYRKERRHDSPEMRAAAKAIKDYLKGEYSDGGETACGQGYFWDGSKCVPIMMRQQPERLTAQDNTRVVQQRVVPQTLKPVPVKKQPVTPPKAPVIVPRFDRPDQLTAKESTNVVLNVRPDLLRPMSIEEINVNNRQYEKPNVSSDFTQAAYDNLYNQQEAQREKERQEKLKLKDYTKASPEDIGKLQVQLIKEGYSVGATGADKKYGDNTHKAYQAKVEDDALDLSTIDRYYNKYQGNTVDKRVVEIQKDLVRAGFLKGDQVDGKFGPITKAAIERYNSGGKEDTQALVFRDPPAKIKDTRCAAGMCSILEAQDIPTADLGMKYTDAWNMVENMNKAGNSKTVYNIYDDKAFQDVNSASEIKAATNRVKKTSQTTANMYKVGDIVGLYHAPSSHHADTLNSKTHNTHVGWVQEVVDGVPIIAHNINGKIYQQPYTELITTWIQRPNDAMLAMADGWKGTQLRYNPTPATKYNTQPIIQGFERKIERPLTVKEKQVVGNVISRAHTTANQLTKELKSSVDPRWVEQTVFGIAGTESAGGLNAPRTRDDMDYARQAAHALKGTKDSEISFGVGKIKYSSLDDFSKEYFQINGPGDLANDNKNVDLITYNLIKAYETFKDYSEKFPELGLQEKDIRNMAILAHNQGVDKLLKTGRSDTKLHLSPEEEVAILRSFYNGTVKDVNSTNYKYAGAAGKYLYDAFEDGSETYISKVNRYATEVYGKPAPKKKAQTPPAKPRVGMMKGGEFNIYKDYVTGAYEGTPKEEWAKQTYDKLNRVYYKDAKDAGLTVPNYIMSKVLTL